MGVVTTERRDGGIAIVTVDRPAARNALSAEVISGLREAFDALEAAGDVGAAVLTGAGGVFVSGADIAELKERRQADAFRRINTGLFRRIEAVPFPTIAAIEAYALGGGLELAMACDLRVASRAARFGQPEVGLGIVPGAGGTYRLPRLVGLGRARELIFTGALIDADEAHRIGLVNRLAEPGAALDVALALAGEIARNAPLAVRLSKQLLATVGEMSVDAAMALESTSQAILFEDPDKQDRMARFLGRRQRRDGASG